MVLLYDNWQFYQSDCFERGIFREVPVACRTGFELKETDEAQSHLTRTQDKSSGKKIVAEVLKKSIPNSPLNCRKFQKFTLTKDHP